MKAQNVINMIRNEIGYTFSSTNQRKVKNILEAWAEEIIGDDETYYSPVGKERNRLRSEQRKRAGIK